jgi:hypothetical protein
MSEFLITRQVAERLGTKQSSLMTLLARHPHLRPAKRLPNGVEFLWTEDEIEKVKAHKLTHKGGRPQIKRSENLLQWSAEIR